MSSQEYPTSIARNMPCPFRHEKCIVDRCPVWRWTDDGISLGGSWDTVREHEGKGYCGANGQDIPNGPKVWINGVLQR
jgi:hypothetical protein